MPETSKDHLTRKAILQAAMAVFQKWGLTKTTMEDIAREARKGKSTLYYYYRSKEEIFDSVVKLEFSALRSSARASVRDVNSARERLRKYIIALMTGIKSSAPLYDIIRGEIAVNPSFLENVRKPFEQEEVQFLQDILALGVQQNHFSFANDHEMATAAEAVHEIVRSMELSLFVNESDPRHIEIAARMIAGGV